jgi:hypothetical protein
MVRRVTCMRRAKSNTDMLKPNLIAVLHKQDDRYSGRTWVFLSLYSMVSLARLVECMWFLLLKDRRQAGAEPSHTSFSEALFTYVKYRKAASTLVDGWHLKLSV